MSTDSAHHSEETPQAHDQAAEVAHAWAHFHENWKFFLCFFGVVLLTVIAWSINFGPTWNFVAVLFFAAARTLLIAYFMATLFKQFSFVTKTFIFGAIFLAGMIWLSLWDSTIKAGYVGDPIRLPGQYDTPPAETPSHVP
jgi:hypothetical protein